MNTKTDEDLHVCEGCGVVFYDLTDLHPDLRICRPCGVKAAEVQAPERLYLQINPMLSYDEQDTSHSFDRLLNMSEDGTADVMYMLVSTAELETLMGAVSNDLIAVSRRLAVQKMTPAVEQHQRMVCNNLWAMKERLSRLLRERSV